MEIGRLHTKSRAWQVLSDRFADSVYQKPHAGQTPHRQQNRLTEEFPPHMGTYFKSEFKNEPNTDWSLTANRKWAEAIRQKWKKSLKNSPLDIPLVIGSVEIIADREIKACRDPSQINANGIVARFAAVRITKCQLIISIPQGLKSAVTRFLTEKEGPELIGDNPVLFETDDDLINHIPEIDRIRFAAPDRVPLELFEAAAKSGFYIARSPVVMEGRIELLHYYRQQSICYTYHRYGNLGDRTLEWE